MLPVAWKSPALIVGLSALGPTLNDVKTRLDTRKSLEPWPLTSYLYVIFFGSLYGQIICLSICSRGARAWRYNVHITTTNHCRGPRINYHAIVVTTYIILHLNIRLDNPTSRRIQLAYGKALEWCLVTGTSKRKTMTVVKHDNMQLDLSKVTNPSMYIVSWIHVDFRASYCQSTFHLPLICHFYSINTMNGK